MDFKILLNQENSSKTISINMAELRTTSCDMPYYAICKFINNEVSITFEYMFNEEKKINKDLNSIKIEFGENSGKIYSFKAIGNTTKNIDIIELKKSILKTNNINKRYNHNINYFIKIINTILLVIHT